MPCHVVEATGGVESRAGLETQVLPLVTPASDRPELRATPAAPRHSVRDECAAAARPARRRRGRATRRPRRCRARRGRAGRIGVELGPDQRIASRSSAGQCRHDINATPPPAPSRRNDRRARWDSRCRPRPAAPVRQVMIGYQHVDAVTSGLLDALERRNAVVDCHDQAGFAINRDRTTSGSSCSRTGSGPAPGSPAPRNRAP